MRRTLIVGGMGILMGAAGAWAANKPVRPPAAPAKAPAAGLKTPPPAPTLVLPRAVYAVTGTLKVVGDGAWDSVTIDDKGKLLYVARTTRTQVIDLATGKVVAEIGPGAGARAVALVPEFDRGFITNMQDGTLTVFDLKTNAVLGTVTIGGDPDCIAYDQASKRVLVCCPVAKMVVPVPANLDLKNGKAESPIDVDGAPHGIVVDEKGMAYVTVTDKDDVVVLDTRVMRIATRWSLGQWHGPTGIAIDRTRSRLFAACGSRFNGLSATDGHDMGEIVLRKTDSWRYPAPSLEFFDGRIFGTCGDGTLEVLGQNAEGRFEIQQTLQTEVGARPIAIDPKTGKIYMPCMESDGKKPLPGTFKIVVVEKK